MREANIQLLTKNQNGN